MSGTPSHEAYFGFTILDKELFVVGDESSTIEVYDLMKFDVSRRWKLNELIDPVDIVSCNRSKCLYILDYKCQGQYKEIFKVDLYGKLLSIWSLEYYDGFRLSVTNESNVIFAVHNEDKLCEYMPNGDLVHEIKLSSDAGICHPWHAIKLINGEFLVSHRNFRNYNHTVSIVDADGKLIKSFGGRPGSIVPHMNVPFHLFVDGNGFVFVADYENRRVLLLDSDLEFKTEILSNERHGLQCPQKILLDESRGRMFVGHNESCNPRILIFDLK